LLCAAATFVFVMDSGLLSIAFPKLSTAFKGTSRATLSWTSSGYSVAIAALMTFTGTVADRLGRKKVYLGGLALYTVAALGAGLATNVWMLIAARVLQGAGSALFLTAGLAIAIVAFPPGRRATALAVWGIAGSAGAVVSPTVGAAVLDTWSWRWAFIGLAAFAAIALGVGLWLPDDRAQATGERPPDPIGVGLAAAGIALVVLAIVRSQLWGWIDLRTLGCLAAGIAVLPVVGYRSIRHPRPLIPPELRRHREYLVLSFACLVQQIAFFSYFFSLPLILTGAWHWSTLKAGYAMAISMAVSAGVVFPCARWVERRGYTRLVIVGAAIGAASCLWWMLTFRVKPNTWWALAPGLAIFGIGSSITGNFMTGAALRHVPASVMGQGNALHQMGRRIGGAIGVALTIALIGESRERGPLLAGGKRAWVLLIVVHVIMTALFLIGQMPNRQRAAEAIPSQ
jgi:EmrB/QacA subfamily drug resistance transporter